MSKIGFILPPKSRFTGAAAVNADIFKHLSSALGVLEVKPDTDYFYQLETIGTLLNYFTLYSQANNYDFILGTSFATLAFAGKSKIIQMFHSLDTASYAYVLKSLRDASIKDRKISSRWLGIFDNILPEKIDAIEARKKIAGITEKHCAEKSISIICVAPCVKKQLVDLFDIDPGKITVVLNGIPDYWFTNSPNEFCQDPVVHYPTRLNYGVYTFLEKGHDRCYEIFAKIKNKKEIYVGLSGLSEGVRNCYEQLVKKHVRANLNAGFSREDIQKSYSAGDIILTTSRTEACQLTLLEAMASKMCPVTYPVGIVPEIIKNGKNGFIVNSTSEAINKINLLTRDPQLRESIGNAAYETVAATFTMQNMLNNYKQIISKIIQG